MRATDIVQIIDSCLSFYRETQLTHFIWICIMLSAGRIAHEYQIILLSVTAC